jgi:hypothetical protein
MSKIACRNTQGKRNNRRQAHDITIKRNRDTVTNTLDAVPPYNGKWRRNWEGWGLRQHQIPLRKFWVVFPHDLSDHQAEVRESG